MNKPLLQDAQQQAYAVTLSDRPILRARAAGHNVENNAVTVAHSTARAQVIDLLNAALASRLVCVLRYNRHYHVANGVKARAADESLEHAEAGHAQRIAAPSMGQKDAPDFGSDELSERSDAHYPAGCVRQDMIGEDLLAERIAIDNCREFIRKLGSNDPTTHRLLQEILATEEEHADDLAGLLQDN